MRFNGTVHEISICTGNNSRSFHGLLDKLAVHGLDILHI